MQARFPTRFGNGPESHLPLFRWSDGTPLTREALTKALEASAVATGVDPTKVSSHSLRKSGATAMYLRGVEQHVIQRFGRWTTGTFHAYLCENFELQRGLSEKMTRGVFELIDPQTGRNARRQDLADSTDAPQLPRRVVFRNPDFVEPDDKNS